MKVLVADDERLTRMMVCALVRRLGYEPCEARDGLEALAILRGPQPPRLAVLDWVMPGLDGVRLCQTIRAESADRYTYIILLTGRDSIDEMVEGLDSGADDFVAKPVEPEVLRARLRSGQRILELQEQLIDARERLREQATRDALTGLLNRGRIIELMHEVIARGQRENRSLGIAICDLDHFKSINDTYGHLAGDQVLRHAAQQLKAELRGYDYIGRYGGEEFLLVLPDCTQAQLRDITERLRQQLCRRPAQYQDEQIAVSMSVGAVFHMPHARTAANELLLRADECLYEAKRGGRNRVVFADLSSPPVRYGGLATPGSSSPGLAAVVNL